MKKRIFATMIVLAVVFFLVPCIVIDAKEEGREYEIEKNNSAITANEMKNNVTYVASIGYKNEYKEKDYDDYFKFTVEKKSEVKIYMGNYVTLASDISYRLDFANSNDKRVDTLVSNKMNGLYEDKDTGEYYRVYTLEPDTYYIHMFSIETATYSLRVEITPVSEPEPIPEPVNISKCTINGISNRIYTGDPIAPKLIIKYNGKTLKNNTDYTYYYSNNIEPGFAKVTIRGIGDYTGTVRREFLIQTVELKYRAYVQKKNWLSWQMAEVSDAVPSSMAGTTDNLRMETIQMQLDGLSGTVRYRAYVEKMGWTQWATTADKTTYAGTKGKSRRVEMIQLETSGNVNTYFDIYYRAYSEKLGWLGWAKNGEKAGTAGYAYKLEAFQINFMPKGKEFGLTSPRTKCFYDKTKDGANPK